MHNVIINCMRSHHQKMIVLLILLLLLNGIASISAGPITNTFLTEIISPFNIPMDDLETAAKNQLSRNDFKNNHFTSHGVEVTKLIYKTNYNGSERIINLTRTNSSRHSVTKDSLELLITYQAVLHPNLPTKKTYNGTTTLKLYLNYTKGIDTSNGTTEIQNLTIWIDKQNIRMNYSGNPNSSERKLLDSINNGTSSEKNLTIVYLLEQQQFSPQIILSYFDQNLISQKISPTFNSSYLYQFGSLKATFDMTTAKVQDTGDGIAHSLKGAIKGFNSEGENLSQVSMNFQGEVSYHTLFTLNFMKNVIMFSLKQNSDWRSFKLDRNRFKLSSFGWRLIDLQYLVSAIPPQYRDYYLNDFRITCSPFSYQKVSIDEVSDKMSVKLDWGCQASLLGISPTPIILDFDIKLLYLLGFAVQSDRLNVLIQQVFLESFEFREVGGFQVTNLKLAKYYAKEMVQKISGYTVGSSFRVKEGSSKVALKENQGLWIG